MVKVRGPLWSLWASGHISVPYPVDLFRFNPYNIQYKLNKGDYFHRYGWVYETRRTWHGLQPTARRFVYPPNPRTPKQQANRYRFASAVFAWQLLSPTAKDYYARLKYPNEMSGYNRFLRHYLLRIA